MSVAGVTRPVHPAQLAFDQDRSPSEILVQVGDGLKNQVSSLLAGQEAVLCIRELGLQHLMTIGSQVAEDLPQ
jgi:hypothetical protein